MGSKRLGDLCDYCGDRMIVDYGATDGTQGHAYCPSCAERLQAFEQRLKTIAIPVTEYEELKRRAERCEWYERAALEKRRSAQRASAHGAIKEQEG